jgi:preprotein translocase subunit SecG
MRPDAHLSIYDMKLNRQTHKRVIARLDRIVFVVAVLWLATSLLLMLSYRTGSAQAAHPRKPEQQLVAHSVPPAEQASLVH